MLQTKKFVRLRKIYCRKYCISFSVAKRKQCYIFGRYLTLDVYLYASSFLSDLQTYSRENKDINSFFSVPFLLRNCKGIIIKSSYFLFHAFVKITSLSSREIIRKYRFKRFLKVSTRVIFLKNWKKNRIFAFFLI